MDDYHVQEFNALMKGQETGGGCLGLGRMCHSCIVSKRKRTGITYASGHRMLQGDRSLMNCQARFFVYGPGCRRDLSEKKEHGPRYARGRIRWETNSTS